MKATHMQLMAVDEVNLVEAAKQLNLHVPLDENGKLAITKDSLVRQMLGEKCSSCQEVANKFMNGSKDQRYTVTYILPKNTPTASITAANKPCVECGK